MADEIEPPPLERNDYSLELFQGPLLAPGRITGLAGATTAIAESVEGVYNNAAAPAVRESNSVRWFEYEPSVGIAFPGAYGGTDFNNRGEKGIEKQIERNRRLGLQRPPTVETTDRFLYLQAGIWGQFGPLGISAVGDQIRYDVNPQDDKNPSLSLALTRIHVVGAWGFLKNQVCVGAGARMVVVNVDGLNNDLGAVISMFGAAPQVGLVVKPEDQQWRLGATARAPVSAGPLTVGRLNEEIRTDGTVIKRAGSFVLPERITQPWEVEAGIAYQLGPRPLNPLWINPHEHERETVEHIENLRQARHAAQQAELAAIDDETARTLRREAIRREEQMATAIERAQLAHAEKRLFEQRKARYVNWPRERVMLLASVLMTGPSEDAVAIEAFIDQRRETVGRRVALSPRIAVESEPVPNLMKFRAGIYMEPSRFAGVPARQHFTFGTDFRLFTWDVFGIITEQTWRLSAFVDMSPRYQNFGFGIGSWH
jgi:hypothetical protein